VISANRRNGPSLILRGGAIIHVASIVFFGLLMSFLGHLPQVSLVIKEVRDVD
jgi:hypothetical protein